MDELIPLHCLPVGNSGRVMHILGCPEHVQRVREMGIHDGVHVEMVRSGGACIVRTGDQTVCLRGSDVFSVLVQPGAGL
jgi:Fe2+ transport system protein FeoA